MSNFHVRDKLAFMLPYFFPRIRDAMFVGTFIAITRQGYGLLNGDGDLARHITVGNYILTHREIPIRDLFSHTMTGQRIVPHEWLAQLTFGGIHAWLGLNGVILLVALLIATTFILAYQEMVRRNVFRIFALLVAILAAYTSSLHWLARPHIFTFLFTAVWAYALENQKGRVWIFPLIMVIWANTHGAFIVGFLIWAAHAAGWLWECLHGQCTKASCLRLGIIGASSFAVTFINPAGWHQWDHTVSYLGNEFLVDQTLEYRSPDFHNWSTWPFLTMLALGVFAGSLSARWRPHEAILFAGWTVLSLYSARHIPLFAIITAPALGAALQAMVEDISVLQRLEQRIARVEHKMKGVFWPVVAVVLVSAASSAQPNRLNQFDPNRFPVGAADWLSTHPQEGNMFNSFLWGGYLLYRLWPEYTVFIDGQTDFYGEALTREYTHVISLSDGWEAVLRKYDISWALIPSDRPLVRALQNELEWRILYRDETAVILRKP